MGLDSDTTGPVLALSSYTIVAAVLVPSLRYWRLDRALTQEELAHRAGVGRKTVMRGEAGQQIRLSSVSRLAAALHLAPGRLQRVPPVSH